MSTSRSRCWGALAVVFFFCASEARAEMITPDSIPNAPARLARTAVVSTTQTTTLPRSTQD